ncbi:MAG: PepSY domain-containing protein [Acidimicrobiales bacterium]
MSRTRNLIAIGAIGLAAAGIGTGVAVAGGGDDEVPITGEALQRASAAALAHTGGGRVTETEVGDEEGFYEVEVTLDDGRQVDVHLDRDFNVLGSQADEEGDDDGGGDDD